MHISICESGSSVFKKGITQIIKSKTMWKKDKKAQLLE